MAWLPSYQELRDHPKTRRLTVVLGVPRAQVIGHLHCLWWWALTYAEDGNLAKFDELDVALAAEWEGDPQVFIDALLACGGGGGHGFLAREGDVLVLHDWMEYGGKYVDKRRRDAARLRESRQSSEVCTDDVRATTDVRTDDVRATTDVRTDDVAGKRREEKKREEKSSARPDVDGLCELLSSLVEGNGCRKPSITKTWRDEARRLLDKDGVDRDEAERVMRWALADNFWRANVLSMPKFREKYDQLLMQANSKRLRAVSGDTISYEPPPISYETPPVRYT